VLSAGPRDHAVVFYRGNELVDLVGEYLLTAVKDGGVAIVVAAPDHRMWLNAWLTRAGVDLAAARSTGSYLVLDADETMRRFMVNGYPDPAAFWQAISPVLTSSTGRRGPVRFFGEMVSLLWDAGLVSAAIEVEALWNEMARQYPFSLLCAYRAGSVTGEEHSDGLAQVCAAHTSVVAGPVSS
jgi:MEDS: MEthanogen/methylotroph, DcmR Sensory domain